MCYRTAATTPGEELTDRYTGSRLLLPFLPAKFFLRIDQVNFLFSVLVTFVAAIFMRNALKPRHTAPWIRHLFAACVGVSFALFMYGNESAHLFIQTLVCWVIIQTLPASWQHLVVFPIAMTYLSVVNIRRMMMDYGGIVVNVTGAMMILTQRMIMLSLSVYDGHAREKSDLNETEKRQRVLEIPNFLEMLSFTFFFPAITSGPLFFFNDYKHFIEHGPPPKKSCIAPVMRKIFNGAIAMALTVLGNKRFDPKIIAKPHFIKHTNIDEKMIGCITGLHLTKSKFYFAWSVSDATCNIAGFGYQRQHTDKDEDDLSTFHQVGGSKGKCRENQEKELKSTSSYAESIEYSKDMDEDDDLSQYKAVALSNCGSTTLCKHEGSVKSKQDVLDSNYSRVLGDDAVEATDSAHQDWHDFVFDDEEESDDWDLTSNIKPSGIELAPNLRSVTDNWNIQTHNWVKYVCYDRCPSYVSLTSSYILIALWHGFYPGYWISFVQAAILTKTSRLVRRVVRPYFLSPGENYNTPNPEPTIKKRCYDFLTWFTTSIFVAYNMAPFFLLEFGSSVAFYRSVGWIGHIVVGSAFIALSILDALTAHEESSEDNKRPSEGGLEGLEATWSTSNVPRRKSSKEAKED